MFCSLGEHENVLMLSAVHINIPKCGCLLEASNYLNLWMQNWLRDPTSMKSWDFVLLVNYKYHKKSRSGIVLALFWTYHSPVPSWRISQTAVVVVSCAMPRKRADFSDWSWPFPTQQMGHSQCRRRSACPWMKTLEFHSTPLIYLSLRNSLFIKTSIQQSTSATERVLTYSAE